jgi:AcrR family transcriptional regulator
MEAEQAKREQILNTAARLFSTKRFDEVKLDDIASRARLGKGTVYLYFKSKEDLYGALIVHGLDRLLDDLRPILPGRGRPRSAWRELSNILDALLAFKKRHPQLDAMMRASIGADNPTICQRRDEIAALCEQVIRRGIESGEMSDPHPELTAQYVLSFVRVALLYAPPGIKSSTLRSHILRVLGHGIRKAPVSAAAAMHSSHKKTRVLSDFQE